MLYCNVFVLIVFTIWILIIDYQDRINRLRTLGMNNKICETEFIEENSHCHLCSTDMAGPCAYQFRVWMACASALDNSDKNDPLSTPQLSHKQCQGALNKYVYVTQS